MENKKRTFGKLENSPFGLKHLHLPNESLLLFSDYFYALRKGTYWTIAAWHSWAIVLSLDLSVLLQIKGAHLGSLVSSYYYLLSLLLCTFRSFFDGWNRFRNTPVHRRIIFQSFYAWRCQHQQATDY